MKERRWNKIFQEMKWDLELNRDREELTLFLKIIVALEAAAETIKGLTTFANPESNGVYRSPKGSHFLIGESVCLLWRQGKGQWGFGFFKFQLCVWWETSLGGENDTVELG